jgi:hypothetical protein
MGYDPHGSGLLHGGGVRSAKQRRNVLRSGSLRHFPDVHLTDSWSVRQTIPDFDPSLEHEYSQRELLLLAEKMLLEDSKPCTEHPAWLSMRRLRNRQKHEIYTAAGIPDPSIQQGMYWRTHPEGRKWRQPTHAGDRSFYR